MDKLRELRAMANIRLGAWGLTAAVTIAWIGFMLYLAVLPEIPEVPFLDNSAAADLGHFSTHLVLAVLVYLAVNRRNPNLGSRMRAAVAAIGASIALGLSFEGLNLLYEERETDTSDIFMNSIGAVAGVVAAFISDRVNVGRALLFPAGGGVAVLFVGLTIVVSVGQASMIEEKAGSVGRFFRDFRYPPYVNVRVASSADDAEEEISSKRMYLDSGDLELVREDEKQLVGIRFNKVAIHRGAKILNAYVQFQVDETTGEATSLTIQGEAVDNAATFSELDGNISSRTRTQASANWRPSSWDTVGDADSIQRTPDISSVIQEILDRASWSRGNSLVLIFAGSGRRIAESYDGDPKGAPQLHVEYTNSVSKTYSFPQRSTMTGLASSEP